MPVFTVKQPSGNEALQGRESHQPKCVHTLDMISACIFWQEMVHDIDTLTLE